MTRAITICITLLVVTLLILNAFKKDDNLPEPTTTIEIKEIKKHFEEEVEISAEISEEDPDIRTGTYEFEIDKSTFHLGLEYNRASDKFKVKNISDLVSRLRTERTDTPYRAYHNNRVTAEKLWGSNRSHYYGIGYERRVIGSLSIGVAGGLYIGLEEYAGLLGIRMSYGF